MLRFKWRLALIPDGAGSETQIILLNNRNSLYTYRAICKYLQNKFVADLELNFVKLKIQFLREKESRKQIILLNNRNSLYTYRAICKYLQNKFVADLELNFVKMKIQILREKESRKSRETL